MLQSVYLVSHNVPGYGLLDGRHLPCSGVSGITSIVSSCSSRADHILHSQVKVVPLKCTSKRLSFVCKASSSGHRRNPDFSRQNRHGYSRNKNRQNEEKPSFENLEEPDVLPSKNGPLLSLANAPKSHATAAPGPREKEIVELFRKVQAQLRERAAQKEEKKIEASQGQIKGGETVDSLLKLLRKHSVEQGKRSSSNKTANFNQIEQNGLDDDEGKSAGFFGSNSSLKDEVQEPTVSPLKRPISKFQRKSPVPRIKYQPVNSGENTVDSIAHVNSNGRRVKIEDEASSEPILQLGSQLDNDTWSETKLESELEADSDSIFPDARIVNSFDDASLSIDEGCDNDVEDEQQLVERRDLSTLKLTELRALAKSRGIKGFSKMKKSDLVELLSQA